MLPLERVPALDRFHHEARLVVGSCVYSRYPAELAEWIFFIVLLGMWNYVACVMALWIPDGVLVMAMDNGSEHYILRSRYCLWEDHKAGNV